MTKQEQQKLQRLVRMTGSKAYVRCGHDMKSLTPIDVLSVNLDDIETYEIELVKFNPEWTFEL